MVPTDNPLSEHEAWLAFRDVILGLEYREFLLDLLLLNELTKGAS